jgi:hypothetical protein
MYSHFGVPVELEQVVHPSPQQTCWPAIVQGPLRHCSVGPGNAVTVARKVRARAVMVRILIDWIEVFFSWRLW